MKNKFITTITTSSVKAGQIVPSIDAEVGDEFVITGPTGEGRALVAVILHLMFSELCERTFW